MYTTQLSLLLPSMLRLHLIGIIHFQCLCKLDVIQSTLLVREWALEESIELCELKMSRSFARKCDPTGFHTSSSLILSP